MLSLLLVSLLWQAPDQAPAPAVPVIEVPAADVTQELELMDGSRVIGRVESVAEGQFTFRTASGVLMEVKTAMMRSLKPVTGRIVGGELWPADSNPTRLFFAPTGRALKKGEAYFGVYEIMLPFVQIGVTDRFSIGGGTPLMFGGGGDRPMWVTPKLQVLQRESTAASIGVLHFFNIDGAGVGIAYGVVTQGNSDSAATLGLGYAYARTGDEDGGAPVAMIGGEHRLSRRVKLVTENYVFDGGGFASGGLRLLGERLSADLGFVVPLFEDVRFVMPMINFVWKF
jgi:hypothetical protein